MKNNIRVTFDNGKDDSVGIGINDEGQRSVLINEFDIAKMHPYNIDDKEWGVKIAVLGKPGTGKSCIIKSIMYHKSHIVPTMQVFSGTESINNFYSKHVPRTLIHDELDATAIGNSIKRQKAAKTYLANPWLMQILDDVVDDQYVLNDKSFNDIYKKGRHMCLIHLLAAQVPMDLKTGIRICIDYCFLLANPLINERVKLYKNFASGCIPTFEDFCDLMDEITEDKSNPHT